MWRMLDIGSIAAPLLVLLFVMVGKIFGLTR